MLTIASCFVPLLVCCIRLSLLCHSQSTTPGQSSVADAITGPHYIEPLPVDLVLRTGYPAAIASTCTAGSVYTIRSVDDLVSNKDQLECIYHAGQTPNTIPLGIWFGDVLKFGTSDSLIALLLPFWKGKLVSQLRCPTGDPMYLGMNIIQGKLRIATVLSIDTPKIALAEGEYHHDEKSSLILDYTVPFGQLCKLPPGATMTEKDASLDILENIYPFRLVVDVVRVVGRQSDGGVIYLGKTYLQDPFRPDRQAYNIAFWSIVNYDPLVTNLAPGEALSPLETTFSYKEPGAFQALKLMLPVDNLVVDPMTTVDRFFSYYDAFANLVNNRLGIDFQRANTRLPTVHLKTVTSGIEFLVFKLAYSLSGNSEVESIGITPESVFRAVFKVNSRHEPQKATEDVHDTLKADATPEKTAIEKLLHMVASLALFERSSPKQQQQRIKKIAETSLLNVCKAGIKSNLKATEALPGNSNRDRSISFSSHSGLSSASDIALHLQRLLNTMEEESIR